MKNIIITLLLMFLLFNINAAKVGDYYFKDGTISADQKLATNENPIVGIVFEVSADSKNGKVVSIDEMSEMWSPLFENVPGAKSESDGLMNMADVLKHDPTLKNYPAFRWVHLKNNAQATYTSGMKEVWYLPALDELQSLSNATKTVNKKLKKLDDAILITSQSSKTGDVAALIANTDVSSGTYWSSTEYDGIKHIAHYYHIGVGSSVKTRNKDNRHRVRAVLAF